MTGLFKIDFKFIQIKVKYKLADTHIRMLINLFLLLSQAGLFYHDVCGEYSKVDIRSYNNYTSMFSDLLSLIFVSLSNYICGLNL